MKGTTDKMSGKMKQGAGKAMGDKKLQAKGKMQETKGKAKDAVDEVI